MCKAQSDLEEMPPVKTADVIPYQPKPNLSLLHRLITFVTSNINAAQIEMGKPLALYWLQYGSVAMFTRAVKQYVVIFYMTQAFLQPVKVVGKVLHAENQASIRAKSERIVLHHIINLNELSNVWRYKSNEDVMWVM